MIFSEFFFHLFQVFALFDERFDFSLDGFHFFDVVFDCTAFDGIAVPAAKLFSVQIFEHPCESFYMFEGVAAFVGVDELGPANKYLISVDGYFYLRKLNDCVSLGMADAEIPQLGFIFSQVYVHLVTVSQ